MPEYLIQKAVELGKVHKKLQAVLAAPGYLEKNYIAQPKYDGCNMIVILDGENTRALSRTGEVVKSCEHIIMALSTFPGVERGVFLGECWCPDLPFPDISGLFRRQKMTEDSARLQMAVFDHLTVEEFEAGHSDFAYEERVRRMPQHMKAITQGNAPVWLAGSFGHIAETWQNTTAQDVCNKLVDAGGYDGLILRNPFGTWTRGSGTTGEIIKIKRKLSFDLAIIGMEEGKGKHKGRLGALVVSFKGKYLRVGTGFSDMTRDEWWNIPHRSPVGLIAEVEAMDYSSDGLLREPRFKGIRFDKLEPDA
jgi:ATP-dependent DNA ligase